MKLQYVARYTTQALIVSVLLLATFLRFYRLPQTMQFLGDQGRDALIARGIFMDRDPAFIGPVTSVGNMYLGPFYYYFMVFPLMLTYPSPVGPALAVASIGVVTTFFMYYLGRDLIGKKPALLAMVLYAVAPVVITNVRFSWNPNIVPFFSLILVWCLYQTIKRRYSYWLGVGLSAIVLFQLHYITLILIGCAGLVWLWQLALQVKQKSLHPVFVKMTAISIGLFFLSLTPLFIFDLKHEFLNSRAFIGFFTGTGDAGHFKTGVKLSAIFYSWIAMTVRLMTETFGIVVPSKYALVSLLVILYIGVKTYVFVDSRDQYVQAKRVLLGVFVTSVVMLSLYKGSVFDHYLGFLFPIATFVIATIFARFWNFIFLRPLVVGVFLLFVAMSLRLYPGNQNLGMNVFLFEKVAKEIYSRVEPGESYDILLLSQNNDFLGMNYRYFLTTTENRPADESDVGNFKKLFVIDEQYQENPLGNPQYKMALWPNRDVVDEFSVEHGPRVLMLKR